MTARITPTEAGCWIDEINGRESPAIVAEIAMGLGWLKGRDRRDTMSQRGEVRAIIRAYRSGSETAWFRRVKIDDVPGQMINQAGIADEATDYLNTLAPEGYAFGWHDGSLFLMSDKWWQEQPLSPAHLCVPAPPPSLNQGNSSTEERPTRGDHGIAARVAHQRAHLARGIKALTAQRRPGSCQGDADGGSAGTPRCGYVR